MPYRQLSYQRLNTCGSTHLQHTRAGYEDFAAKLVAALKEAISSDLSDDAEREVRLRVRALTRELYDYTRAAVEYSPLWLHR